MKKPWTRILGLVRRDIAERDHEAVFEYLFAKHHQHADELVYNKQKKILAAVYFTPIGRHQQETIEFFRAVQRRTMYRSDFEEDPDG